MKRAPFADGWTVVAAVGFSIVAGILGALDVASANFIRGSISVALSVLALYWPRRLWVDGGVEDISSWRRFVWLLTIFALAVYFRTHRLVPPGLWGDDALNGLLAFQVLDGKIASPLELVRHAHSNFHALTNFAIAGAFEVFGPGLASIRLPGIIVNAIATLLLYAITAPLFGARVALLAGAFFASSSMQVSHSKVLLQVVFGQFFQLLGLALVVHGLSGKRRWLLWISAVPLALCLYTYHSAKIAPLVAIAYAAIVVWRTPDHRRELGRGLTTAAVVFLLCAAPALVGYLNEPAGLGRIGEVSVMQAIRAKGDLSLLWDSVWRTLLIFHYEQGPSYDWFGIGGDPALNPLVAFLSLHGLYRSVRRYREPRHLLLFVWLIVGLVPGMLSTEAPRVYRAFLASPPFFIWAAMPVAQLLRAPVAPALARHTISTFAALLVVAIPLYDFNYYFYRVYTDSEYRWFQGAPMVEMARALRRFGPGWTGHLISDTFDVQHEAIRFLDRAWGLSTADLTSFSDIVPITEDAQQGTLFMFSRGNIPAMGVISSLFPEAQTRIHMNPRPRGWWFDRWLPLHPRGEPLPSSAWVAVSRETVEHAHGLNTTLISDDGSALASEIRAQVLIDDSHPLPSTPVPVHAVRWSGALFVPLEGDYEFVLQSNGVASVSIDGAPVISTQNPTASRNLAAGLHELAALGAGSDLRLLWKPPGGSLALIPAAAFFRNRAHGLLAEYTLHGQVVRRIDPFPYFFFYPSAFHSTFAAHWRGRLEIPEPGIQELSVNAKGTTQILIDGRLLAAGQGFTAGMHDIDIDFVAADEAARFKIFWNDMRGVRTLVPPEAFSPPVGP